MNGQSPPQQHENSRSPLPRTTSYSKRHASFSSPREVPLPSPSLRQTESAGFFSSSATTANPPSPSRSSRTQDRTDPASKPSSPQRSYFRSPLDEDSEARKASISKASSSSHTPPSPWGVTHSDSFYPSWHQMQDQLHHMSSTPSSPSTTATPASGYSSIPAPSDSQYHGLQAHVFPAIQAQKELSTTGFAPVYSSSRPFSVPDATSHVYNGASVAGQAGPSPMRTTAWGDRSSSASLPLPNQIPFHTLQRPTLSSIKTSPGPRSCSGAADDRGQNQRVDSVSSSSCEPTSGPGTLPGSMQPASRPALRRPVFEGSLSSGSETSSSSSYATSSSGSSNVRAPSSPSSSSSVESTAGSPLAQGLPPTAPSCTTVEAILASSNYPARPISPFRAPQSARPVSPFCAPRPISPFRAPQPPSPSQILRSPSAPQPTAMRPSSSPIYPPPEPPTILSTDSASDISSGNSSGQSQAPFVPFLNTAPPPPNSWIEVETTQSEYRLHVRLPGFSREGITLATKRRRILHVVADSWENGGGHFERKISFGYDADLVQVRAEFDGEMLRIVIPRRAIPFTIISSPRLAPLGRV